jgi:membrane fusion protein
MNESKSSERLNPSTSLFRPEALEASMQRYGTPIKAMGIGMWSSAIVVLAVIISALLFLTLTSLPRTESVNGVLIPSSGLLPVLSQRPGTVTEVLVKEGDEVQRGTPLLSISNDSVIEGESSTGTALTEIVRLKGDAVLDHERALARATESQAAVTRERIASLKQQELSMRRSLALYDEQLKINQETSEDLTKLRTDKLVSELQVRDADMRVLTTRRGIADSQLRLAEMQQERRELVHELDRLKAEEQAAHATTLGAVLDSREKAINYKLDSAFKLVARESGRITALQVEPGSSVIAGRALGSLMPKNSTLLAELWVPSSAVAFIDIETPVLLKYDSFPYQKFGMARGKVHRIARSPTSATELPVELQAREGHYRILVQLDDQTVQAYGKAFALTPGMRFRADLVLERRSMMEWLMEPLIAARRRQE